MSPRRRAPGFTFVSYQPAFLDPFLEWRRQPSTLRHNPIQPAKRDELALSLGKEGSALDDLKAFQTYRWFIEADGTVVGNVSLKNISHGMGYGEIGYGLAESHQGIGLGTAAVRRLVDMVFEQTSLRKLIAYVHDENVASCRVLEKIGFRREGLLIEHYVIDGKPVNEALYGLLKSEASGGPPFRVILQSR